MSSQKELCFVTWNTRGIKSTDMFPDKFGDVLKLLEEVGAEIAFIQETHVGPECYNLLEETEDWKVYYTVYKSAEKGVAILIRDDVPFEYICHDEDHSGRYIVLFCRLYGELFTLVNVYHHSKDRSVLYQLRDYLQETAEGVLVVGGDFNTALDPYFDRNSTAVRTDSPLHRSILEDFTASLNLRDTWAHLHPTETGYTCTRKQKKTSQANDGSERSERSEGNEGNEGNEGSEVSESRSRIDMFFMPANIKGMQVTSRIQHQEDENEISDHDPVVLTLKFQPLKKIPAVASMLKEETKPDRRADKISGAEILSAIKSLTDPGVHKIHEFTVDYYKQHRSPLTETLKIQYNSMLKKKYIPSDFNACFNVDYLIFSQILARRLMVLINLSFKSQKRENKDLECIITFRGVPEKIMISFLMETIENQKKEMPLHDHDFSILGSLLPKDSNSEFRLLRQGCPLTDAILTLALNKLRNEIKNSDSKILVSFCRFRKALFIQTEKEKLETIRSACKKFTQDSGIKLK